MAPYAELDQLKAKLDSLRPFEPQRLLALVEKFRLEWTYHSNALEGNPLSLNEMSFFVLEGLTSEGNGRVARLVMNSILMQAGYTPAIIPVETKKRYLEVLQFADDGICEPLFAMVEKLVSKSLRMTISIVEDSDEELKRDWLRLQ